MQAKKPYYVVNLLEEIDQPGEWYFDRAAGSLYFWPPEDLDKGDVLISTLEAPIIVMKNASHIRIEGLTIEMGVRNGIEVSGGSDVWIERCTVRNMRGNGIEISGTNHGVVHCTIHSIGQTGVAVSGGDRATLVPGNNFVRHCTIHDFGRWQRTYAPAIRLNGVGNIAANNKLYDAPHSAILFNGNEHRIELNEIYGVCYEVDDAGSVYAGRDWGLRGNVIENNFFHDIESHLTGSNGVHAVYLDDCASGITVVGNVFYRISGRAIMCGGGRDNTIDNNVIARCGSAHFTDRRGKAWMDKDNSWKLLDKIKRYNYTQPPWSERYPRLAHILDNGLEMAKEPEGCIIARNLGWKNERWLEKNCLGACGGFDFYTFQDNIEDQDPKFVDEANLNLALRDDSPAYSIPGFKRIPFEKIGPQESDNKLGGYAIDEAWMAEAMKVFNAPKPKLELPTKHPDAQWFPQASFGLFLHWGIHSVDGIDPSWSMMKGCPWHGSSDPYKKYNQDQSQYYGLAEKFHPTQYDPDKWMASAKKAGFTYAVLTTKHHDGYALWPTNFGDFSTKQYMGGRDLLKPYVDACRKHGLKVGFYFSPRDWHYPGYPQAMEYRAKFPLPPAEENFENFKAFYAYTLGQIHELLTRYGRIDLLWVDGMGWSGVGDMRAEQTLAWVRSLQPGIVINPRWSGFGDFATTECTPGKPEHWKPGQWWEACDIWPTGHWGYVPSERFKPLSWVLGRLANCRAWGGNFLCNVGPRPDGTMPDVFYNCCDDLSQWMAHSRDSVIGAGLAPGEDRSNVPITRATAHGTCTCCPRTRPSGTVRRARAQAITLLRTGRTLPWRRQGDPGAPGTIAIPAELRTDLDDVIAVRL
jgi:alpha-L-fucosidase